MHSDRIKNLQDLLTERAVDALILIPSPSLYYLTGLSFHLMERPILGFFAADRDPLLFLPAMESAKAEASSLKLPTVTYDENPASQPSALRQAWEQLGLPADATVALEPLRFRFFELQLLRQAAGDLDIQPADELTSKLRVIKDEAELAAMQRAVDIAEQALTKTLPLIKIGMTEQELQAELVVQLLRQGSETELPFQPIVAAGPNSALPHAGASNRPLEPGDLLLIDWGATYQGYCSDLTRTFALSETTEQMQSIHQAVLAANQAGRQAIKPGVKAGALDRAARDKIEQAGFGARFTHRLGHGLGLEAHEPPYLFGENERTLERGMTFTVEPGVYIPGMGGVRIEDDVVVTETGARSLSGISRDLRVLA